jgi:plasmid stabilization system protein ParE
VQELRQALLEMLGLAEGTGNASFNSPIALKSGELLVYAITGAGLFEVRRQRGDDGKEAAVPVVLDHGRISITTQRVAFSGAKYTREWPFAKLIRVKHFDEQPWTGIRVTTRERMSGFTYRGLRPEFVRSRMTLAVAIHRGQQDQVAGELRQLLAEIDRRLGSTPEIVTSPPPEHQPVRIAAPRSAVAARARRPAGLLAVEQGA